ncbi:hypothetical protein PspLS_02587 [Pyricularia sp. CBS 133598]|nr:hypothetical protein PspLS_02587 [Pyricularia sp. CBS 133598]
MPSSSSKKSSATWQSKLEDACREFQISAPKYQLVSDRRGGRTAWSSQVTIYNQTHAARFWYDGKNLHNAREDAAEVAWNWLTTPSSSPSTSNTASW